jgi:hypothetical protein
LPNRSIIDILIVDPMPKQKLHPLPSAAFHILLALADDDLHGYAIMRHVAEQTGGRMRLGPGTLYSSIQALVEEKLIKRSSRGPMTNSGRSGGATTASPPPAASSPAPKPNGWRICCAWPAPRKS